MGNEQPYSVTQLAQAAGVSETYVRRLVSSGRLAGVKVGSFWMIPADVGRAWLEEREAKEDKRK